jgi:hypothetical protein
VAFANTVNLDNNSTILHKWCECVQNMCKQCLYNRSKGLCTHRNEPLEISEIQILAMDLEKLKWIQECHDSPVTGHQRQAKTYELLGQSHSWSQMRKDVDRYI